MTRSRGHRTKQRPTKGPAQAFASNPVTTGEPWPRDFIEGFAQDQDHLDDIKLAAGIDPPEAAARQQELISHFTRALRIRQCGHPNNSTSTFPGRRCNLRQCPSCSKAIAARNGKNMAAAVRQMTNPTVTLFTLVVPWSALTGASDLQAAISDFRNAHREIRRLDCFAGIKGGIGAIETKVIEGGGFNLHAHLVVDLVAVDEVEVNAMWQELVQRARENRIRSRGRRRPAARWRGHYAAGFSICPDNVPKDIDALSIYSTKSTTWSPLPGTVRLPQLRAIQRAIWRRHLVIRWGNAMPPKLPF